jgi:hypothetical protein
MRHIRDLLVVAGVVAEVVVLVGKAGDTNPVF